MYIKVFFCLFVFSLWSPIAYAAGAAHSDPIAPIILTTTGILFFAILGRLIARKLNQPSVLGELIVGILIGNILYFFGMDVVTLLREGPVVFDVMKHVLVGHSVEHSTMQALGDTEAAKQLAMILQAPGGNAYLQVAHVVDGFSRYGVIFMLFLVGLESSYEDVRQMGGASFNVAILGVFAPIILGFFAVRWLLPGAPLNAVLFIAATLSATSVGISARVLYDLNQHYSPEARIILGAAVIDDVLGLIILSIISGIVLSGGIAAGGIIKIIALAGLFFLVTFSLSPIFLRGIVSLLRHLEISEAKLFISFIFVMALAWFANFVGLATIIGAFAAGLILHDGYFHYWGDVHQHQFTIKDLVSPLEAIFVPIFFVLIGVQVKLESFIDIDVLLLAFGLLVAATLGKLVCGLGSPRGTNRWVVGIGMLPRGEVGLVFAAIGRTLEVISDQLFSAIVLMVIVTTLLAPPLLKYSLRNAPNSPTT